VPTVQVTDHRWRVIVAGQFQRVGRYVIEAGYPDTYLVLTTLSDDVGEDLKLSEYGVKPQPDKGEPPLRLSWGLLLNFSYIQPA
jgi:hypothetical protein